MKKKITYCIEMILAIFKHVLKFWFVLVPKQKKCPKSTALETLHTAFCSLHTLHYTLHYRIRNGYGMSEMVGGGIVPHPDTAQETMEKGSIGQVRVGWWSILLDVLAVLGNAIY